MDAMNPTQILTALILMHAFSCSGEKAEERPAGCAISAGMSMDFTGSRCFESYYYCNDGFDYHVYCAPIPDAGTYTCRCYQDESTEGQVSPFDPSKAGELIKECSVPETDTDYEKYCEKYYPQCCPDDFPIHKPTSQY